MYFWCVNRRQCRFRQTFTCYETYIFWEECGWIYYWINSCKLSPVCQYRCMFHLVRFRLSKVQSRVVIVVANLGMSILVALLYFWCINHALFFFFSYIWSHLIILLGHHLIERRGYRFFLLYLFIYFWGGGRGNWLNEVGGLCGLFILMLTLTSWTLSRLPF